MISNHYRIGILRIMKMESENYRQIGAARDKTLGDRIALYRKMNNWTQLELSLRTGITRDQISRIERGVSDPKLETIVRIENALGLPQWTLLRQDSAEDTDQSSDAAARDAIIHRIIDAIDQRNLSVDQLRIVEATVISLADAIKKL